MAEIERMAQMEQKETAGMPLHMIKVNMFQSLLEVAAALLAVMLL
jgi:hypothetical protein